MHEKFAKGAFWTLVEQLVGGQVFAFLVFLILARVLAPEDFGVLTLASAFVAIPQVLINQGFQEAIIQRELLDDDHLQTAFWTNLGLAAFFVLLCEAFAGLLDLAFGHPGLAPVLRVISCTMIFTALTSVPSAVFRRTLNFYTFALRTVVASFVGGVVGIWMAYEGYGVWALVGNVVVNGALGVIVMFVGSDWRPRLHFSRTAFAELFGFTWRMMLASLIGFFTDRFDVLVVGYFFDATVLGWWYLVQRLIQTIHQTTVTPIDSMMMPVLSRMQHDREALADTYGTMSWMIYAVFAPITAGLGVVAPTLVPMFFGTHWGGAVPLIQVISLICVTYPIARTAPIALLSLGNADGFLRLSVIKLGLTLLMLPLAAHFGMLPFTFAFVGVNAAMVPISLFAIRRVGRGVIDSSSFLAVLASVAMMAVCVVLIQHVVHDEDRVVILLSQIIVGAGVYVTALLVLAREQVARLLRFLPVRFQFIK